MVIENLSQPQLDIEITLSNFENIGNGWGNSLRIFPNTENKKYLIVYTTVYYEGDTSQNILRASIKDAQKGSPINTYIIAGIRDSVAINSYRDLFMIIDYENQKINTEGNLGLWLCLMKNTTETVSCNGKAIFKSPRFYFSD